MKTAAERGREVRQRLLQAASELIVERGWGAVSTRLLADRAGVSAGVVHYHFSSVQSLLVEAALGTARSLATQLGGVLCAAGSAEEAVGVLSAPLDQNGDEPMTVLFIEAYLAAARDENLRLGLGAVIADFRQHLTDVLGSHGVPDPEATALVLAASIDGMFLHRTLLPAPNSVELAAVLRRLVPAPGVP